MTGTYNYARNQTPMVWQGAWVATLLYNPGATVSYLDVAYTALVTNTGVTPVAGATWAVTGAALGFAPLLVRRTLTQAEFLALGDTPIQIVAAPGADKVIVPIQATGVLQLNGKNGVSTPESVRLAFDATAAFIGVLGDSVFSVDNFQVAGPTHQDVLSNCAELSVSVVSQENPVLLGAIATSALSDGGADWSVSDVFTLGNGAIGVVDTVLDGAVVTYHFSNAGTLERVGADQEASAGDGSVGTGLLIDINSIDSGEGSLTFTVELLYRVMDL